MLTLAWWMVLKIDLWKYFVNILYGVNRKDLMSDVGGEFERNFLASF